MQRIRKWIPFRGDDYSKKYIPRSFASLSGRLFVIFIFIPAAVFVIVKSINTIFAGQEVLPFFWLLIAVIVFFIIYFAAKDARKINSKKKDLLDD